MDEMITDRLAELTTAVRQRLKRTAEDVYLNGQDLLEAKLLIAHGDWGRYLLTSFEMSTRTAERFIQVYERFKEKRDVLEAVPVSALYLLAEDSTPQEAIEEIESRAASGQSVSKSAVVEVVQDAKSGFGKNVALVKEKAGPIIQAAVARGDLALSEAARIVRVTENASERIQNIVNKYGVRESGVVNALKRFEADLPEELDAIEKTGLLQFEGEQAKPAIPLEQVTVKDATAVFASVKEAAAIADWEATRPLRHVDVLAKIAARSRVQINGHERSTITITVDYDTYKKAEGLIDQVIRLIIQEP